MRIHLKEQPIARESMEGFRIFGKVGAISIVLLSAGLSVIHPPAAAQDKPEPVRGVVVDERGRPAANVQFGYHVPWWSWRGPRSDEKGEFSLSGFPRKKVHWIAYSQHTEKMAFFSIAEYRTEDRLRIVLDLGLADTSGRVVDSDGQGVANSHVRFRFESPEGQVFIFDGPYCDAQGYYQTDLHSSPIPVADGYTFQVGLSPPPGDSATAWSEKQRLVDDQFYIEMPDLVLAPAQADTARETKAPRRSARILESGPKALYSGFVVDEEGQPIEGVGVELMYRRASGVFNLLKARTDSEGRWRRMLSAEMADLQVSFVHRDYKRGRLSSSLEQMRGGTARATLERGNRVRGVVRDSGGNPIAHALILPHYSYSRTPGPWSEPIEDSSSARTNDDGSFTLRGVNPRPGELTVLADGYRPAAVAFDPRSGGKPIEITVLPGDSIHGRVLDAEGNPIEGVRIGGSSWQTDKQYHLVMLRGESDAEGRFEIAHVPDRGEIRSLSISKSGFLHMSGSLKLPRTEPWEFTMYAPPVISGTVVDEATGEPITEFETKHSFGTRWLRNSKTIVRSDQGKFRTKIGGISIQVGPTTSFAVRIMAQGYYPSETPYFPLSETPEPVVVRLRKGDPWTGIVVDPSGRPVEQATAMWVGPGETASIRSARLYGRGASSPEWVVSTEADGRFEFPPDDVAGEIQILHRSGYAHRNSTEHQRGSSIELIPWARIEGIILEPVAGLMRGPVSLTPTAAPSPAAPPPFNWIFRGMSDDGGHFAFDYVPSIPLTLGRPVGSGGAASTQIEITPQPGETHKINIGQAREKPLARLLNRARASSGLAG